MWCVCQSHLHGDTMETKTQISELIYDSNMILRSKLSLSVGSYRIPCHFQSFDLKLLRFFYFKASLWREKAGYWGEEKEREHSEVQNIKGNRSVTSDPVPLMWKHWHGQASFRSPMPITQVVFQPHFQV